MDWHLKNENQTLQVALGIPKTLSYFCPAWLHSQPWYWPPQGFGFCLSFCLYFTLRFSLNWHKLVSAAAAAAAAVLTQDLHGACRSYPNFNPAYIFHPASSQWLPGHHLSFSMPGSDDFGIRLCFTNSSWHTAALISLGPWPCAASLILHKQGARCYQNTLTPNQR